MKLLALDGNSIVNRAFFGIKLLTTKDGQYTNGIYGFLNILHKLEQDVKPDAVAIAFDLKAKTFRHEMYSEYKGNRKGMAEELASQMPVLKEILSSLGYVLVSKEGYEADDILGTLARAATESGNKCFIATGDRDSLQLANENVNIILATTQFGKGQNTLMDTDAIREKYGLEVNQLIDLKALMGDTSDNIPGVKGVGEKTAVSLLQQFGTLDNIYANIDDPFIKKGVRAKLEADKEMAYLSKQLGKICTTAPVETDISHYVKQPGDMAKAAEILGRLEMYTMIDKFCGDSQLSFETVSEESALETVVIEEFTGTMDKAVIWQSGDEFILTWDKTVEKIAVTDPQLKTYLEDASKEKIAYNVKALHKFCFENDIKPENISFCLTLAAYIVNPLASSYAKDVLPMATGAEKAFECEDAFAPFAHSCYTILRDNIEKDNQHSLLHDIEMPLAEVLANMEHIGFAVDRQGIVDFGIKLKEQIEKDQQLIYDMVGEKFNLNSPKQLGHALFEVLGLPAGKKTKTGYSTNAETLEGLRKYHPVIDVILNYRSYQKLNSTYVEGFIDKIQPDGRIYSTFNQTETRTGRISSSEPNLQNIPVRTELGSELRKFFVAKPGHILLDADYSQIELRILAHISGDKVMAEAFLNGEDIHARTASQVLKLPMEMITPQLRSRAKAVNFGIVYGIGAFSLSKDTGMTVKEADAFIKDYLHNFSGVAEYMNTITQFAKEHGYVTTLYNRKRLLPEINNSNKNVQALGTRMAMNTPIQGTSADIIKIAMVRVYNRLKAEGLKAQLVLQVHDELIVEAPLEEMEKAKQILSQEMMNAAQLSIPLKADVNSGENWYIAKG
ncbi:MAG: DNA polymerase I [Oscillospiraceae bacterium]|nr:DNA polymerase I [Oscillospiraceae bacterium]